MDIDERILRATPIASKLRDAKAQKRARRRNWAATPIATNYEGPEHRSTIRVQIASFFLLRIIYGAKFNW